MEARCGYGKGTGKASGIEERFCSHRRNSYEGLEVGELSGFHGRTLVFVFDGIVIVHGTTSTEP